MAVIIEFVNVIVRKSAVESRFPGGLDGFARQDLANLTEDDYLLRVGFMSTEEALHFASGLEAVGLRYLGAEADSDIAVVVWDDSPVPPWLSVGSVDGYRAGWSSDQPPGELGWPEPGFLLRCPRAVYDTLPGIAGRCGAELQKVVAGLEPGILGRWRCVRGDAEILIDVIGEPEGISPVGLWGCRQLVRRRQFRVDVALIHDVVSALSQAGAEEVGGAADQSAAAEQPHE